MWESEHIAVAFVKGGRLRFVVEASADHSNFYVGRSSCPPLIGQVAELQLEKANTHKAQVKLISNLAPTSEYGRFQQLNELVYLHENVDGYVHIAKVHY